MTEINKNNLGSYSYNIKKVGKEQINEPKQNVNNKIQEAPDYKYAQDTGVLGRSQVTSSQEANIAKSVDEAVSLAAKRPQILLGSESVFDSLYETLIEEGMEPSEAYMQALLAEEEFLALASSRN